MYYINPKGKIATCRKVRNIPQLRTWRENTFDDIPVGYYFTQEQIDKIIQEEGWKKIDRRTMLKIKEGSK